MSKVRLFISTDMQMVSGLNHVDGDKDDVQSLIHALMYQDKLNIVGIASSTSKHQPGANDDRFIEHVINTYGKDRDQLAAQADGFKTANQLNDIVYQGTKSLAGSNGFPARTEASDAIIREAHEAKAAGEKLYVATWGGLGDVARALHDAPDIAGSIRLLSASGPVQEPNAHRYIKNNFAGEGDFWWIDARTTQRGIYASPEGKSPISDEWAKEKALGHGALGDLFYANTQDVRGKGDNYDGVKMGDSFSIFYLIDQANNNDPTAESWGGEYRKVDNQYWVDRTDENFSWSGSNGARTTYEDRAAWTSDFAKRLDWLNEDKEGDGTPTNKAPIATDDELTTLADSAVSGNVLANDRDAEGDKLSVSLKNGPDHGSVKLTSDGRFAYTPDDGFSGKDDFTYVVSDGKLTSSANVTIDVTASEEEINHFDDPILSRSKTLDASSSADQRLTMSTNANSLFVDVERNSGSDRILSFGHNDVLVLSEALKSGELETVDGWLVLDKEGDRLNLPTLEGVRLLGTSDSGLFVYADAAVPVSGSIESTLGNDRLSSSRGTNKADTFFFDTALGLDLGNDDIFNFGARDQLVTTRKLLDGNGDGILSFGKNDGLDLKHEGLRGSLGHVRIFDDAGDQVTSLSLERTMEQDGVSYFVYMAAE